MTANKWVFIGSLCAASFWGGMEVGLNHVPKTCPTVANERVISTIDAGTEQVCIYVPNAGFGRSVTRRKV